LTWRRLVRLLPLVAAIPLAAAALAAPRFTWANEGVIIDHPWSQPAAAAAAAVAAGCYAVLARPRPLRVAAALAALLMLALASWQLRFRVEAVEDGLQKRTLTGSVRLAWKELATVEPRAGALTVRARDGQVLSIATGRFAPEDRNRLERTIARRVMEASRESGQ
jgi:hypothetical protein